MIDRQVFPKHYWKLVLFSRSCKISYLKPFLNIYTVHLKTGNTKVRWAEGDFWNSEPGFLFLVVSFVLFIPQTFSQDIKFKSSLLPTPPIYFYASAITWCKKDFFMFFNLHLVLYLMTQCTKLFFLYFQETIYWMEKYFLMLFHSQIINQGFLLALTKGLKLV